MSKPVERLQEAIDEMLGALTEIDGTSGLTEADRTDLESLVIRLPEVRRKLPNLSAQKRRKLVHEVVLESIAVLHRLRAT